MTPGCDCAAFHLSHFRVMDVQNLHDRLYHSRRMTTLMLNPTLISMKIRQEGENNGKKLE